MTMTDFEPLRTNFSIRRKARFRSPDFEKSEVVELLGEARMHVVKMRDVRKSFPRMTPRKAASSWEKMRS